MWNFVPMRKPCDPPENRPSVSSATSCPNPAPINAEEGFNISSASVISLNGHTWHSWTATRTFISNNDDSFFSLLYLPFFQSLNKQFFAVVTLFISCATITIELPLQFL